MRWQTVAAAGLGLVLAGPVMAPVAAEETKSAEEIVKALQGAAAQRGGPVAEEPQIRMRGLRVKPKAPPAGGVDLTIHFRSGSAEIESRSEAQVAEIAKALEALGEARLQLIGHTDTRGSAEFNRQLSERRAQAVMEALVREYGIDPRRLVAEGHGEAEPLVTPEVDAIDFARNRRVELRLLTQ